MNKGRWEAGFTLIEVMIVVAISTMIAYTIFVALLAGENHANTAQIRMTIQDSAREGLYRMIQEIRQSAPDRITLGADNNSIQFQIPDPDNSLKDDYTVNWNGAYTIQYALGGLNNRQIVRNNMTTGQTTIVANDVTDVAFTGVGTNPRVITVTMSVQRALTNGRLIPEQPLQMTAQAEVRNA